METTAEAESLTALGTARRPVSRLRVGYDHSVECSTTRGRPVSPKPVVRKTPQVSTPVNRFPKGTRYSVSSKRSSTVVSNRDFLLIVRRSTFHLFCQSRPSRFLCSVRYLHTSFTRHLCFPLHWEEDGGGVVKVSEDVRRGGTGI